MMNWDDLRYFLAVSSEGSIRGAARALSVNHSTISRRVASLESDLGARLFERIDGAYVLTSAGEQLLKSARKIEAETHAITRTVAGQDDALRGGLRVTMPNSAALKLLMPDLVRFTHLHPEIDLELVPSFDVLDLSRRAADVAIRFSNQPSEDLVGRRVLKMARAVYASVDYLRARGWPDEVTDLCWIGWRTAGVPKWVLDSPFPEAPVRHRINNSLAQLEAAKQGLGLTMLPCFIGDTEPTLRRVSPAALVDRDVWVLTHEDLRRTARVQTFMRFIATAIERRRELLEGRCAQSG